MLEIIFYKDKKDRLFYLQCKTCRKVYERRRKETDSIFKLAQHLTVRINESFKAQNLKK